MSRTKRESHSPAAPRQGERGVPSSQPAAPNLQRLLVPFAAAQLLVAYDEVGVREIRFSPNDSEPPPGYRAAPLLGDALGFEIARQLRQYFAGEHGEFELPLAPDGTRFQWRVWEALSRIPLGTTQSYGDIARQIGNPRAARAVGQAIRRNRIPIIVPCHRVITARGAIGGYMGSGGESVEIKRWLLDHERRF